MKQTITLGDMKLTIRRMKVREIKELLALGKDKLNALLELDKSDNFTGALLDFLLANFDWATGFIASMTDQSQEMIEELDVSDLVQLTLELLKLNGLTQERVTGFFTKFAAVTQQMFTPVVAEQPEQLVFEETIPAL